MRRHNILINMMISVLLMTSLMLMCVPSVSGSKVFPGAVGFGTDWSIFDFGTPTVYKVTNLQKSGDGSLKACIEATGPRICVFEVSGYIDYTDRQFIRNPYIIIAGQTAPEPGITLKNTHITIATHHVVMQHIRVRQSDHDGRPPPENRDCLNIWSDDGTIVNDVVIDHCSFSWAIDEVVALGGANNATFSNSISAEGLHNSIHDKTVTGDLWSGHSKGLMLINSRDLSVFNNLIANNDDRNPIVSEYVEGSIVNNLIYKAKVNFMIWQYYSVPSFVSVVGNHNIGNDEFVNIRSITNRDSRIYLRDNKCDAGKQGDISGDPESWEFVGSWYSVVSELESDCRSSAPLSWPQGFAAMPVDDVYDHVLANAGARPCDRDSADSRIIQNVIDGKGSLVDCVEEGWVYYPKSTVRDAGSDWVQICNPEQIVWVENPALRVDDAYNGMPIIIEGGDTRTITDYDGETCKATVSGWSSRPLAGDSYKIQYRYCDRSAGGWPILNGKTKTHAFDFDPNANNLNFEVVGGNIVKSAETQPDPYRNIEEWLYAWSRWWECGKCGTCGDLPDDPPDDPPEDTDIFCGNGAVCDTRNWIEWDSSRWDIAAGAYRINTNGYPKHENLGCGEMSAYKETYDDFILDARIKSTETDTADPIDYAIVFGYRDPDNYHYFLFDKADTYLLSLDKGVRSWWVPIRFSLDMQNYHSIKVEKDGRRVRMYVDGQLRYEGEHDFTAGKIGIGSLNDGLMLDDISITRQGSAVFCELGDACDTSNWEELTWQGHASERWGVQDGKYGIIVGGITNAPDNILAEYSLFEGEYDDFIFEAKAQTLENIGDVPAADLAVLFGYRGVGDYDFMDFNAIPENNYFFSIEEGSKAYYKRAGNILLSAGTHSIKIKKKGDTATIYFDDMNNPKMTVSYPMHEGKIGIGSVNDRMLFDDIRITGLFCADLDDNGIIDIDEMIAFLNRWKINNDISTAELMEAVSLWLRNR